MAASEVDVTIMQRLALIKHLYRLGRDQARQPQPQRACAVLTFHDSIELLLALVAETTGVSKARLDFLDYWEEVDRATQGKVKLPHKLSMSRLNKARVGLKHHGLLPSSDTVGELSLSSRQFLEDSTLLVFSVSFDDITLEHLVASTEIREALEGARIALSEAEPKKLHERLQTAFRSAMQQWDDAFYVPELRHEIRDPGGVGRFDPVGSSMYDFANNVCRVVASLGDVMRLVALGIDVPHYNRFRRLLWDAFRGRLLDKEEFDFCRDFIISTALVVQGILPNSEDQ